MNVFIIPSWYPGKNNPVDGIFIKEQADALSANYPEHNFIVSHCGNFYLSLSSVFKSVNTLKEFAKAKPFKTSYRINYTEYFKPALTWSDKLNGEFKNILKVHFENFTAAVKDYGKISVIHAHVSYPAGYAAMKLKQKYKLPYILSEHMGPFPFERFIVNGKISHKISEPLIEADIVTAPSNYQSERIHSSGFKKPVVIPNMFNEELFFPAGNKSNKERLQFLTLAAFKKEKGIYELLDGILKSDAGNNGCEFIIAGSGELENYIKQFILKNDMTGYVRLIISPDRNEIVNLFRNCDVFILPSRLESFGIVYIEALGCGKPVIATDCGGPSDFINSGNGLLIQKENPDLTAEAINYMKENISNFDPAGIRKSAVNNFSSKAVCSELISLYQKLTGTGK